MKILDKAGRVTPTPTFKRGDKLTKAHALKVLSVVDAGLVHGLGKPVPGEMCVEAAVNFALGLPHNDNPPCVGEAVRAYKIRLNDANWPSNKDRTEGMREIAIAQLGSNEIDQKEFAKRIALKTIQQIVPIALRAAGSVIPKHKDALEVAAIACEAAIDLVTGKKAADAAYAAANAAAYAAANANAYAADAAYAAADAAAYAAANANAYAAYAAYAAANAAAYAADAARKSMLQKAAAIGVTVLRELKCQGVKWIGLCNETQP